MQERRARIMSAARSLILRGSRSDMTVRTLASLAGVTMPTIYRLVGKKDDIFAAVFAESQAMVFDRIAEHAVGQPLALAEAVPLGAISMLHEDEEYFRAGYLAMEYLDEGRGGIEDFSEVYRRGHHVVTAGFQACIDAGLLAGRLPADILGKITMQAYRFTWRQWTFRHINQQQMMEDSLTQLYVALMSDATEPFKSQVFEKLDKLKGLSARAKSRSTPGRKAAARG